MRSDPFCLISKAPRVLSLLATAINIVTASLNPPQYFSGLPVIYAYKFQNTTEKKKKKKTGKIPTYIYSRTVPIPPSIYTCIIYTYKYAYLNK